MQLVVVNAVAAAVMAATITFNSTSQKRLLFMIMFHVSLGALRRFACKEWLMFHG